MHDNGQWTASQLEGVKREDLQYTGALVPATVGYRTSSRFSRDETTGRFRPHGIVVLDGTNNRSSRVVSYSDGK